MRAKSQLSEESLKSGNNSFFDNPSHSIKGGGNLHAFCGSLIERYNSEDLDIHLHLSFSIHGKGSELCILIKAGHGSLCPRLSLDVENLQIGLGLATTENGDQNPSVLVDVSEFIQNPESGLLKVLPQVVRLQTLDECVRVCGNPRELPAPDCLFESFGRVTDGEYLVISGLIVCSKYKFPYKVIQGGSEVLEEVAHDNGNPGGDRSLGLESSSNLIRIRLLLGHQMAWVRLEVPLKFRCQVLKMLCGPEDFVFDVKKGAGHTEHAISVRLVSHLYYRHCESGLQWFSSTAEGRLEGECLVGARNFGQANDVRDGFYEFVAAHALWPAIAGNIHPNDSARPFFISFPRVRQARRSLL
jgi:hypothetical protein